MFDRLIDILATIWDRITPIHIVNDYEEAVVLRFGTFDRVLKPGAHGVIPVIERVIVDSVVPRTTNLNEQSLTTKDDISVTLSAVITTKIRNIRKATLEVEDLDSAIADACYGSIGWCVANAWFTDLTTQDFLAMVKGECQTVLTTYGITIRSISFENLTRTNAYRLFGVSISAGEE